MTHRTQERRHACGCGSKDFIVEEYNTHRAECIDGYMQITKTWLKQDAIRFVCARCKRQHVFRAFDTTRLCMLLDS